MKMEIINIEEVVTKDKPTMHIRDSFAQKVNYLCNLLPNNEWSGILFYKVNKSPLNINFPDITCEDLLLMDVGGATTTEFSMNSETVAYMAEYPELIDCQIGLIHSHANMKVFYSGTDLNTLRENGEETNHFVSLVVNNAGDYLGAITRKVNGTVYEDHKVNYHSFNNEIGTFTKLDTREYTDIEYCVFNPVHSTKTVELSEACKKYFTDRVEELKKAHKSSYGKELTLWDETDNFFTVEDRIYKPYRWSEECSAVDLACLRLITLNPFAYEFNNEYFLNKYARGLSIDIHNRFSNEDNYFQYLDSFIDTWICEIMSSEDSKEFLEKVIHRLQEVNCNSYIENIILELSNYLADWE